jgi:hypothetical protein
MRGLLLASLLYGLAFCARDDDARFQAALHREMVAGDLAGAVEQYRAMAASARVLWRMGLCLERLGQRKEARAAYSRLVAGFAGEPEAGLARRKLANWTDAAAGPRNLAFEQGEAGKMPPGWFSPAMPAAASVQLRRVGCRSAAGCATVQGSAQTPVANLMQSFSAAAYRGKTVRLRAWMRVDRSEANDRGQAWLRTGQGKQDEQEVGAAEWGVREIVREIEPDAEFIDFGFSSVGRGTVWVDGVTFELVPKAEIETARQRVEALYARLDAAADGGLDNVSSLVAGDARVRRYQLAEPLLASLTAEGPQTSLVQFRLSANGAVATVRCEYASPTKPAHVSTFRDSWARSGDSWKLQSRVFLTGHQVIPPAGEGPDGGLTADLKRFAAPLATTEAGHTSYDLAPFGTAVGGARVVALGEPVYGAREFVRVKHRLLEYLVTQQGFTVLATPGDPAAASAVDRFVKTGEGDPAAALASLNGWIWRGQEALELVRWMQGSGGMTATSVACGIGGRFTWLGSLCIRASCGQWGIEMGTRRVWPRNRFLRCPEAPGTGCSARRECRCFFWIFGGWPRCRHCRSGSPSRIRSSGRAPVGM